MAAVSQTLIEFANGFRQPPAPGIEVMVTPRYQITIQPDFPIPGPNSVSWIRCRSDEIDDVVREARAAFALRNLPFMWLLDPGAQPPDLVERLAAHGIHADPHGEESAVMVLPIDARIESPTIEGLEIHDALADLDTFRNALSVSAEAFMSVILGDDPELVASQERRRRNQVAAGDRTVLLATVDGELAGTGGMTIAPPAAAMITGGAVRPKFRNRGVYHALLAARLEIARRAGVSGLMVWGGAMSAPILARLGFTKVGWRRFYLDTSTAEQADPA